MARTSVDIAIYAMGGGFGHIMRACGLARALLKARADLTIRLYFPRRGRDWARKLGFEPTCPPLEWELSPERLARWIQVEFKQDAPTLLVVDCFPSGFHGELTSVLPEMKKRVLLTRWLDAKSLSEADWVLLKGFSKLICTETIHPDLAKLDFIKIEPVLAVAAEDILERAKAREYFQVGDEETLVLLISTRLDLNALALKEQLRRLGETFSFEFRFIHPGAELWERTFPVGRYLRAADLVVVPPGSSYYEVVQAGVPAVFTPLRLDNDNHRARALGRLGAAHHQARVAHFSELSTLFPEMLHRPRQPIRPLRGSAQAAALLLAVLDP